MIKKLNSPRLLTHLRLLRVRLKLCGNLEKIIIISMNKKIEISNKATADKKWWCDYSTKMEAHLGIAYICF